MLLEMTYHISLSNTLATIFLPEIDWLCQRDYPTNEDKDVCVRPEKKSRILPAPALTRGTL